MAPPPKVLGVDVPPRDWGTEIQAVRDFAQRELREEHTARVGAQLELLAKLGQIGTDVSEHGRVLRSYARSSNRRQWIGGILSSGAVIAAITALGNAWAKRIEVHAPAKAAPNTETEETVRELRKRLATLDEIVEEHRRALRQRPLVRDPDVITGSKSE